VVDRNRCEIVLPHIHSVHTRLLSSSLLKHHDSKNLHGTSLGSLAVVADLRTPSFPRWHSFQSLEESRASCRGSVMFLRDERRRDAFAQLGKDLIATPLSDDSSTSNPFTSNQQASMRGVGVVERRCFELHSANHC
jgi:hypothetical protein